MNAPAIDRSEEKAHGRTGVCPSRGSMGNRAPISHHKFKARSPSLTRRNWGGAMTRSAHFLSRAGWGCSLDALADIRTRILAGTDERLAALLADNIQPADHAFHNLIEPFPRHSPKPSVGRRYVQTVATPGGQNLGNPSQQGPRHDRCSPN